MYIWSGIFLLHYLTPWKLHARHPGIRPLDRKSVL